MGDLEHAPRLAHHALGLLPDPAWLAGGGFLACLWASGGRLGGVVRQFLLACWGSAPTGPGPQPLCVVPTTLGGATVPPAGRRLAAAPLWAWCGLRSVAAGWIFAGGGGAA